MLLITVWFDRSRLAFLVMWHVAIPHLMYLLVHIFGYYQECLGKALLPTYTHMDITLVMARCPKEKGELKEFIIELVLCIKDGRGKEHLF